MKKFKVGQTVYYFLGGVHCDSGTPMGKIVTCKIKKATKDLFTGKVTYTVSTGGWGYYNSDRDVELSAEYLYADRKKIEKEHKDEIAYMVFLEKLNSIENVLYKIMNEYADKMTANPISWATISAADTKASLYIEGIGNVQEEFDRLKKEVEILKKKIKKPTKKSVKLKESNENDKVVAV